ncbi:MAG: hypothetical protein K8J08_19130 [Thermoanaerobaculia bacterium]|nr:hypothetical protein [Thermoanaerobaculia bacterium]
MQLTRLSSRCRFASSCLRIPYFVAVVLVVAPVSDVCWAQSPIHRDDIVVTDDVEGTHSFPRVMYLGGESLGDSPAADNGGRFGVGSTATLSEVSGIYFRVADNLGVFLEPSFQVGVDPPFGAQPHAQVALPRPGFSDLVNVFAYVRAGSEGGEDTDAVVYDEALDSEVFSWEPGIAREAEIGFGTFGFDSRLGLVFRSNEDLTGAQLSTIYLQTFDVADDISPVNSLFEVNDVTGSSVFTPGISSLNYVPIPFGDGPEAAFVVVWESFASNGSDNSLSSIQARLFDLDGAPMGGQFQVNTSIAGFQRAPNVVGLDDGTFVVVWHSDSSAGDDDSLTSIQGQLFDGSGTPIGGEFQVNDVILGDQYQARVAAQNDGGFIVVWTDSPPGDSDIAARQFLAGAVPKGDQFRVNTLTSGPQTNPHVAASGDEFVVVWQAGEIYMNGTLSRFFADGFESGDTSGWGSPP